MTPSVWAAGLDFLAVFVEAGEKENFLPETAPGAGDHVGDDLLVGVAKVRLAVDVINGCCYVKRFAHPRAVWRSKPWFAIARNFSRTKMAVRLLLLPSQRAIMAGLFVSDALVETRQRLALMRHGQQILPRL